MTENMPDSVVYKAGYAHGREEAAAEMERLRKALERIEREGASLWLAEIAAVALRGEEG